MVIASTVHDAAASRSRTKVGLFRHYYTSQTPVFTQISVDGSNGTISFSKSGDSTLRVTFDKDAGAGNWPSYDTITVIGY